jgi:excisionase family DNA binding protein
MILATSTLADDMLQSSQVRGLRSVPTWPSLTVEEASRQSGYNVEYLRRLIRAGKIEAVKVGSVYLIRAESLNEYIRQTQTPEDDRTGPRRKR